MELPGEFLPYRVGQAFSQGDEIKGRMDSAMERLKPAKAMLEERPDLLNNQKVVDLFTANAQQAKRAYDNLGGVCQCLVLKWLKLKMKERAEGLSGKKKVLPDTRLARLKSETTLDKAIARQGEAHKQQGWIGGLDSAKNQYKMGPAKDIGIQPKLSVVTSTIQGRTHGFFLCAIGIKKPESGNHAIGAYTSGGKILGQKSHVYVFDPNFGELAFPTDKFNKLMRGFLYACYETGDDGVLTLEEFLPK